MGASRRRGGRRRWRLPVILRRRWLAVGALCLIAFLYYRPIKSYLNTRETVRQREQEVQQLRAEHEALLRRLALTDSGATLQRAARRLGLVKPGERLFIVKGIPDWRRANGRGHPAAKPH